MNAEIKQLFSEYVSLTRDTPAAALLVLADVLGRKTPDPTIVESDDKGTVSVKEAAESLKTSSKKVYQMCLAGKLHCNCIGGRLRIPIYEIEHCEGIPSSPALVPRKPQ